MTEVFDKSLHDTPNIDRNTTLQDLSAKAVVNEDSVWFPGARPPDRDRFVNSDGVQLHWRSLMDNYRVTTRQDM